MCGCVRKSHYRTLRNWYVSNHPPLPLRGDWPIFPRQDTSSCITSNSHRSCSSSVNSRMSFPQLSALALEVLPRSMSTISPTVFHEFVLELGRIPSPFDLRGPYSLYWGEWARIDRFLEKRFASCEGFRLVIGKDELFGWEAFEGTQRKHSRFWCVQFESSHSAERDWS